MVFEKSIDDVHALTSVGSDDEDSGPFWESAEADSRSSFTVLVLAVHWRRLTSSIVGWVFRAECQFLVLVYGRSGVRTAVPFLFHGSLAAHTS